MSNRLPDGYDGDTPLYRCIGECGEELPAECFGGSKDKMNYRCRAKPEGNGCEAKYRRQQRADKKKYTTAISFEDLLKELGDGPKDLSKLTAAQKKARRQAQDKISKMIRALPERIRELHELEEFQKYAAADTNRRLFCDFYTSRVTDWCSLKVFDTAPGTPEYPDHITRRIHWLRSQIEVFDKATIERAYVRERQRIADGGGLFSGKYTHSRSYDDPKDAEAAEKWIENWYKGYVKRRKEREKADRAKAKECPTAEEFAEYLSENLWLVDDKAFVTTYYGIRPGMGGAKATTRAYYARRAGDTTSERKWSQAADEAHMAEREYDEDLSGIVKKHFMEHFSKLDQMPTWAELLPHQYSDKGLDLQYSDAAYDVQAHAKLWQEQRWVVLSDEDLDKVRRLVAGEVVQTPYFSGLRDLREHQFYGLSQRMKGDSLVKKFDLPVENPADFRTH